MNRCILDKELIPNPEIWNLLLRVSHDALHVVAYSIVEENSLIYRVFSLNDKSKGYLSALEEVIYDNPMLLCDFRKVYCLVETERLMVVPSPYSSEEDCQLLLTTAYPDFKGNAHIDPTGSRNATIIAGIDHNLIAFLRRTFHNAQISTHLSSLCRFFAAKAGRSNSVKSLVNLRKTSLDIIMMQGGNLMLANTFTFRDPMDAVYYILACRNNIGLDPHNDEVLLAGDNVVREKIMSVLRTYLARVMPAIFPPQMFKAGRDAMHTPFDLIVTPLCE